MVHRLGDLQLKIMKVLWEKSEVSIPEVHQLVGQESDLAYTTISTMLRKMEGKGLVKHRVRDRKLLYRPLVREEAVARKMSSHFIEGLFEGSLADMVSHLLDTRKVSPEELDKLAELIAEKKKERKAK